MSVSVHETTVNGNRTQIWSCDDSAPVRRLAAALDRDDDCVARVKSSTCYDAKVWLDGGETLTAPDGWAIDSVFASENGNTCVRLTEDA